MNFTFKLEEIKEAANKAFQESSGKKVWAIQGEMGSGKTTFIHALCENLGVTTAIGSPTYSIINEYRSGDGSVIYHMDWYRLEDEEEALQAGVEDSLLAGNLCFVEWPEKAASLLPDNTFHIAISIIDKKTRRITIISA